MALKNPRVNVTFKKEIVVLLTLLAHQENKSIASIVRELASEALEMREDLYLSKLAAEIDKKRVKTYSHNDVWK